MAARIRTQGALTFLIRLRQVSLGGTLVSLSLNCLRRKSEIGDTRGKKEGTLLSESHSVPMKDVLIRDATFPNLEFRISFFSGILS